MRFTSETRSPPAIVKAKRDAEAPAVRERERAAAVAEQERLEDMAKLEVRE